MKSAGAIVYQQPRAARTRVEILNRAVDIASAEGLEGVSIRRLAAELAMSKTGVFAHFGSKEELQLAAVDMARDIFLAQVFEPALKSPRGVSRLSALLNAWLSYIQRIVFPGGCFFAAAAAEFDSRPGKVRDKIGELAKAWLLALEDEVREAKRLNQFSKKADPHQLAFELHASFRKPTGRSSSLMTKRPSLERGQPSLTASLRKKSATSCSAHSLPPSRISQRIIS